MKSQNLIKGGRCNSKCMNFIIVGHGCYKSSKHLLPKGFQLDYYTLENYRLTIKAHHENVLPHEYCSKRMTNYYEPVDYTEGGRMYKDIKIWADTKIPAYLGICKGDKMTILSSIHNEYLSDIIEWIKNMYPDEKKIHIALLTCRPDCETGTNISRHHHLAQSYGATPYIDYSIHGAKKANKYIEAVSNKEIYKNRKEHKEKSPNKDVKGYYND